MNLFTFTGNLGRDPETRFVNESQVTSFSVAINDFGAKDTLWVDVSVWGKPGAACAEHLNKGSQVCVAGSLALDTYKAKDGTERTALKVRAYKVTFIGKKPNDTDAF